MASLIVPLDASALQGVDPKQAVKVLLVSRAKPVSSQSVVFDKQQKAQVTFDVDAQATGLRVIVGPADATDDELTGLQTIGVDVPRRRFAGKDELVLPPIRITPYYWLWWRRWCRTFVVHGRVVCPDGSPVPGAVVCAYDVDAWWWWWSKQQVGCATTDATGSFTITFRWCCGWWPWWWWRLRRWYVEPRLAERTSCAELQRHPRFPRPTGSESRSRTSAIAGTLVGRYRRRRRARRRAQPDVDTARLDGLRERLRAGHCPSDAGASSRCGSGRGSRGSRGGIARPTSSFAPRRPAEASSTSS